MNYEVIIVGGGLGGAALGKALAEAGIPVLVLEREEAFRDRVRGEQMHCWGVAETRTLGVYDLLKNTCAVETRYWITQVAGAPGPPPPRDLIATTPHQAGSMSFYHPAMQEVMLSAAAAAGATVRRGVQVTGVTAGSPPSVRVQDGKSEETLTARVVVGADGRVSSCRRWAGFSTQRDPERMVIAGVLLEGLAAPEDSTRLCVNPERGRVSLSVPVGNGRFRSYACGHKKGEPLSLSGHGALPAFIAASIEAGAPRDWYEHVAAAGPLATFEGADTWVDHPYREGVALIGDAAASSDPSFGCGLSLTLRDARVLRDQLLAGSDWDAAGHAYAAEHDRHYGAIHQIIEWMTALLFEPGPEAAARRGRAMPRIAAEPDRLPDIVGVGPEWPADEHARRRLFGED